MKISFLLPLASLTSVALFAAAPPDAVRILATSPLRFEPGPDTDSNEFIARGTRSRFVFEGNGAKVQAGGKSLRFEFAGADRRARLEGVDKLRSTTGIFIGNDPSKWRRRVPNYGRLQVRGLYRGVDLVYYGNEGKLEYDLLVKPGADPRQIRLAFQGSHPNLDRDGNLNAAFILKRPVAYQIAASGARVAIDSRFRRNADGSYGFALGRYDHQRELVIDPVVTLEQYFAGSSQDIGYAIDHDANGLLFIAGTTYSSDFPTAGPAAGTGPIGGEDLFLAIIDPTAPPASQITYAAFIGGSANDSLGGMVVDSKGFVYLTGTTASTNFPTVNAAQTTLGSTTTNAFVMKLDLFEVPLYSTYLGGSGTDTGNAIAVDSQGRIWVTGGTQSPNFPIPSGFQAAQGSQDAFVSGIDPTQSGSGSLFFSTYLGGTWWDTGFGIAAASDGTIWVVGGTYSYNFPVTNTSFNPNYSSGGDAFVAQINTTPGGSFLQYGTFLGGTGEEEARNIILDPKGRVIVSGYTLSQDFPISSDALQPQYGGNTDAFITILNPANSGSAQLVYSTYFGGSNPDVPFDLKMDPNGNLYVAGFTMSAGLPVTANALQAAYDDTQDAFALEFNPSTPGPAGIKYFTYLGSDGLQIAYGIDYDATNNLIYLTGYTTGPIFDPFGGPGKGTGSGDPDAFVIGFSTEAATTTTALQYRRPARSVPLSRR
jgi:beta-propeller repeat-containing protein